MKYYIAMRTGYGYEEILYGGPNVGIVIDEAKRYLEYEEDTQEAVVVWALEGYDLDHVNTFWKQDDEVRWKGHEDEQADSETSRDVLPASS
jgi:hypothetical protein